MKLQFATIIFFAAVLTGQACAQSPVYLCTDAQGNKEYRNVGANKGCKKVDLPALTTVPAPKKSATQGANGKKASSPASFPKVDQNTQQSRDSDRKQILQQELKSEEKKLADLKAEYKGGEPERMGGEKNYAKYQERTAKMKEDIERTEKNVEALRREVNNLK